jgi:hypothetical protein
VGGVGEAYGLGAVDRLIVSTIEESVLDVELVHKIAPRERQSEHGEDGGGLHHDSDSLIEVHTRALGELLEDPTCLVPIKRTVSLKLLLEKYNYQ